MSSGCTLLRHVASSLFKNHISSSPVGEVFLRRQSWYSFACTGDSFREVPVRHEWASSFGSRWDSYTRRFLGKCCFCLPLLFEPFILALPHSNICVSIISHTSLRKGVIAAKYRIYQIPLSCHIWHAWSCLPVTHDLNSSVPEFLD